MAAEVSREEFFAGRPLAQRVDEAVCALLARHGGCDVRITRSQVAYRRRRGFAFLWLPGRYLARPTSEVVVSIALTRRDPSPRFKEVTEVAPGRWMHHLEVRGVADLDAEVDAWLAEAADAAT